ncbi:MAG TPA: endonuclease/exonuclease/phosphatase family protein [Acidimicrobiales bacterium]
MPTTLVSWNLKGSGNPDTAAVAEHIRSEGADLVALQEVQWHQARRIARALGATSRRWSFKHFPGRTWPEGMAVIGVTGPVHARTRALSHGWRVWSWRRRIAQRAMVATPQGPLTLVNLHLTPHGEVARREVEAAKVLAMVDPLAGPVLAVGDFNERPGGPVARQMAAAGLRDGWQQPSEAATGTDEPPTDPFPTNWRGWRRGTTTVPSRQIDYVYVSPAVRSVEVRVPRPGDDGLVRFSAISDHLPLTAVLDFGSGRDGLP